MVDAHYENPRLAEIYDLDSPWSIDREFYLSLAAAPAQHKKILDLGCGTGLLCNAYAGKNNDVTGVDPSPAMLAVARRKPYGKNVQWVQSAAQNYESDQRFDLIVMTGHAFQVLLDDADILATFAMMRRHVKPDGIIVFESRNPVIDWASEWNYDLVIQLPEHSVHESRHFLSWTGDRMLFELCYRFPDVVLASRSELRFLSLEEIEQRLAKSGLCVDKVLGDWNSTPFDEKASHEMILIVRAK